jgi:hypothetical protein
VTDWKPVVKVVGAVVAGAAWIQFVGGAVLWMRLEAIGLPATQTVVVLPRELLFATGIRVLLFPLIAATVALLTLMLWPGEESIPPANPEEKTPPGVKRILGALTILGLALIWNGPIDAVQLGFNDPAWRWVLTVAVPAAAVLFAIGVDRGSRFVKEDLAVVVREDESAVGGYLLAQSSDAVYLITADAPGGSRNYVIKKSTPNPRLDLGGTVRCQHVGQNLTTLLREPKPPACFLPRMITIPSSQVHEVLAGPSAVKVGARGYRTARYLAEVAVLHADGERLEHRAHKK